MDYSLLVGVAEKSAHKKKLKGFSIWDRGIRSKNEPEEILFLGIIDISQFYSFKKKFIHFVKSIIMKSV